MSIEDTGVDEEMFDITMEDRHHAFVANGIIVHNCNANVVKDAQIILHNRIKELGIDGWIMLTVHDEIVTAVREDQIEGMKRILEESMIEASKKVLTVVPTTVDVKSGPRWTK